MIPSVTGERERPREEAASGRRRRSPARRAARSRSSSTDAEQLRPASFGETARPQRRPRRSRGSSPVGCSRKRRKMSLARSRSVPLGRIGERDHAAHQARDNRVHAHLVERDPDRRCRARSRRGPRWMSAARDEQDAAETGRTRRGSGADGGMSTTLYAIAISEAARRCRRRPRPSGDTHAGNRAGPIHEREQPERERGGGRHRHSPAVDRVLGPR